MRIAYVVLNFQQMYLNGGVGRKINNQCRIWREAGQDVALFIHSSDVPPSPEYHLFSFSQNRKHPVLSGICGEFLRSRALRGMISAIRVFKPDLIYLRFGLFTFPLQRLFHIAPVVVELNTNDVEEYKHRGVLYFVLNRLTRGKIFHPASGLVSTSNEIAALPAFTKYHKPIQTITNGYNFYGVDPLPAPGNSHPRAAFAGISTANWYGLDKLLSFAGKNQDITFDFIGFEAKQFSPDQRYDNVNFHGIVDLARVREILSLADVTFSSLALHRNEMKQASSLKVREALAFGIPLILAYDDPDISGKNWGFVLELPNEEENVAENMDKIRDFIYTMVGKRADRELVEPSLDQHSKEKQRLSFFGEIMQARIGNQK